MEGYFSKTLVVPEIDSKAQRIMSSIKDLK